MTDQHCPRQTGQQQNRDATSEFVHGITRRLRSPPWLSRAAGVGLCSVSIGFVVLFVFVLETGGDLTLITRPLPMQIALALPPVIAVLAAGTAGGAILAWWHGYWSLRIRLHQTVLAVLGVGFSWQLATLGFLSL